MAHRSDRDRQNLVTAKSCQAREFVQEPVADPIQARGLRDLDQAVYMAAADLMCRIGEESPCGAGRVHTCGLWATAWNYGLNSGRYEGYREGVCLRALGL